MIDWLRGNTTKQETQVNGNTTEQEKQAGVSVPPIDDGKDPELDQKFEETNDDGEIKEWRVIRENDMDPWTKEFSIELECQIKDIKNTDIKPILMVCGPASHGKSSFISSLSTIRAKRKSSTAVSGLSTKSVTKVYRHYEFENFIISDVQGVEPSEDMELVDRIIEIVKGHVQDGYQFDSPKEGQERLYKETPNEVDKVRCVIFVFDIREVYEIHREYLKKLKKVMEELYRSGTPRIVLLTHADEESNLVKEDITKIFKSEKILKAIKHASEWLGVPEDVIHPVRNYENMRSVFYDYRPSIPLLLALQQAIHFAIDTIIKNTSNEKSDEEKTEEKD